MPPETLPEPWLSFLKEIDELVSEPVEFHCLGGFVVTTLYGSARSTADFDVLSIAPRTEIETLLRLAGEGSKLHKKHRVYLDFVTIAQTPEDYEERLREMFSGSLQNIRLFALDPYDLALTKIERTIQRDRDDVKHLARTVPFDLEVLKQRYYDELRVYLGVPERSDTTLELWIEAIEEERKGL